MARHEADREDLFAEARALLRRIEARPTSGDPLIVIGVRSTGWLSIYLGPDLMYQFDAGGRLRRAFSGGELYRTQGTTLARLRRERTDAETTLQRRDLSAEELAEFQQQVQRDVGQLICDLAENRLTILRQEPANDAELQAELLVALRQTMHVTPWLAPAMVGKA